jgi:hypothetical protein
VSAFLSHIKGRSNYLAEIVYGSPATRLSDAGSETERTNKPNIGGKAEHRGNTQSWEEMPPIRQFLLAARLYTTQSMVPWKKERGLALGLTFFIAVFHFDDPLLAIPIVTREEESGGDALVRPSPLRKWRDLAVFIHRRSSS